MAPPDVHPTTRRIWDALPEHYRIADARQGPPDYPLLRFLSLIGDQLGELEDLLDRINYVSPNDGGAPGDTSDLVNAATADATWLPFLAQLNGVILPPIADDATRRALIAAAPSGWLVATKAAVAAAAQTQLTGGRYIVVRDHYQDDPWQLEIRTRTSETPDPAAVLQAIINAGAKPAGVHLVATAYGASWAEVLDRFPTWADIVGHTWLDVLETTSTPTAPTPVADSIDARWKVRARAADTLDARWKVLGAATPVADTLDARWRVRVLRYTTITAGGLTVLIYLDLNDAAGTTAEDTTANNRDGTYYGDPGSFTLNQAGLIPANGAAGKAVLLNGNQAGGGGAIITNYQPFAAASQRTFRGVAKRASHANRHALMGGDNLGLMLAIDAGAGGGVSWWPNTSDTAANWAAAWPGDNVAVEWALKHDEAAHTAELLINGVSQGVRTLMPAYNGTPKITVGARGGAAVGFTIDNFDGVVDAFDIVDGLTSNARLAADYAAAF